MLDHEKYKLNFFRVHCFNNYGKNKDKKCPDLEIRYLIECDNKIEKTKRSRRSPIVCQGILADISVSTEEPTVAPTEGLIEAPTVVTTEAVVSIEVVVNIEGSTDETTEALIALLTSVNFEIKKIEFIQATAVSQSDDQEITQITSNNDIVTESATEIPVVTTAAKIDEDAADALEELDGFS